MNAVSFAFSVAVGVAIVLAAIGTGLLLGSALCSVLDWIDRRISR